MCVANTNRKCTATSNKDGQEFRGVTAGHSGSKSLVGSSSVPAVSSRLTRKAPTSRLAPIETFGSSWRNPGTLR